MKKNELYVFLSKIIFLIVCVAPVSLLAQVDLVETVSPHQMPSAKLKHIVGNVRFYTQMGSVQRELKVMWQLSGKNKIHEYSVRNSDNLLIEKYRFSYNRKDNIKQVVIEDKNFSYKADYVYDNSDNLMYILKIYPFKGAGQTIDTLFRYDYDENTILQREIGPGGIRTFDEKKRVDSYLSRDGMQYVYWYSDDNRSETIYKYDQMEYLISTSEIYYDDKGQVVEQKETGTSTNGMHKTYQYQYSNDGTLKKVDCIQLNHDGTHQKVFTVDYFYF